MTIRRLVLDGRVARVVLVLIGWRVSVSEMASASRAKGAQLTCCHGGRSRVDAVEDDETWSFCQCHSSYCLLARPCVPNVSSFDRLPALAIVSCFASPNQAPRRTGNVEWPHRAGCKAPLVIGSAVPDAAFFRAN